VSRLGTTQTVLDVTASRELTLVVVTQDAMVEYDVWMYDDAVGKA
jgi:hypothetical protein